MPAAFQITTQNGNSLYFYDKKRLKAVMRAAGSEIAQVAKGYITAGGGGVTYRGAGGNRDGGRRPRKKGNFTASTPGNAPAKITGDLIRSIKARPFKTGEGVAVRASAFYSVMLEQGAVGGIASGIAGVKGQRNIRASVGRKKVLIKTVGTRVLAPRPFLTRALAARSASLTTRIVAAVDDGVKFQRQKP